MFPVEARNAVIELVPHGVFGDAVERAADQMAERVATEDVHRNQDHVYEEDDCANADSEAIRKPERFPHVVDEERPDDIGEAEEIAVKILEYEREPALAKVSLARLAHGASGGISPKRFVVGAAIVVAGETEPAGDPQDQ
jgi:hypothetical protein